MSILENTTHPRVFVIRVAGGGVLSIDAATSAALGAPTERWRVTRRDGEVLGYIDKSGDEPGHPFHARRLMARRRQLVPVGDFWTMDDAIDALY